MKNGKLRVALVGVSFGAEFIPIYLKHPDVDSLVLVDTNEKLLNTVGDKFLLEERLTDFNAMLEDKTIDAVHLVTPPATHAPLSIQVMNAGKHCACTIPMGMSIDELYQVIDARKRSGKHYMFMETSVYSGDGAKLKEDEMMKEFVAKPYPVVNYTAEQSEEISSLTVDIYKYVNETWASWIVNGGIDEQWDAYVDQLNQMGLERLMEIYQEALDVYNNAG